MKKLFTIILTAISLNSYSQWYPFDSIPEDLKKGADAVIRTAQCLYSVSEPGKATMKIKFAVTLLNEDADDIRYISVNYDNDSKVKYLRASVYDEKGEFLYSPGPSNILDMSAGGSFYSDARMKIIRIPLYRYPFTIEWEYETTLSGIITYPLWKFQPSNNIAVERSGIQFTIPENMKFKYDANYLKNKVDSVKSEGKNIFTWQESNIPAIPLYISLEGIRTPAPYINAAPYDFEYNGIKGSLASWKTFGEWNYNLNKDRDFLSDKETEQIKKLVSGFSDEKQKIKAIYEYMQSRTRYVSIQIGIGGFQSALAKSVSESGFGDCKGLSNYTRALLKAADIESYLTFVSAGSGIKDINPDFVDDQFDHVILCVPLKADTVWLECTSQNLPYNYLGSFTCNRHVLLLTPDGGKIVKTPSFRKEQNILKRTGSVTLNVLAASHANIKQEYSGYYFGEINKVLSNESEYEMKKLLYSAFEYPDFKVNSASYTEDKSSEPSALLKYQVDIKNFGSSNGKSVYFMPSLTKGDFLPHDSLKLEIDFITSKIEIDSMTYSLPLNYKIDYQPENIQIENEFGKYLYSITSSGGEIVLYRRFELSKSKIPESEYTRFREFYNQVAKHDRSLIVLKKT
ncbi:MAG TPA: DUF3857 domain-containing protein [Bacteroidales bacterium]|nr:DUF3857 domain-containing protein [Bacteroidales bacterium]